MNNKFFIIVFGLLMGNAQLNASSEVATEERECVYCRQPSQPAVMAPYCRDCGCCTVSGKTNALGQRICLKCSGPWRFVTPPCNTCGEIVTVRVPARAKQDEYQR